MLSLVSLFNSSCDNTIVISESIAIESGIWNINEGVEFNAEIKQIDKFYDFFIEMDINEEFLTNNLWLFIYTQSPSGNIQSDTIMYYVADDKGKFLGKKKRKTIGNRFLYKPSIQFVEPGVYKCSIFHGMRNNDLPKISKIGIRIEELISVNEKK